MYRKYLEEKINDLKEEIKEYELDGDVEEVEKILKEIEEIKKLDKPYDRIYIENDITINTLQKIVINSWFNFDSYAEMEQPLENLDNGFITPEMLDQILKKVFREKPDGSFPNSTKKIFGTRNKIRYVKSILEKLKSKGEKNERVS